MMTVAITMVWGLHDKRTVRWTGSDAGDDDSTLTFLIALFVALIVSKFLSEVRHGQDARILVADKEIIASSTALLPDYRFKHGWLMHILTLNLYELTAIPKLLH
tara:strand:- start:910 stop:1221 length:312 start_codon:yes stop_codon:yes gene_type:complete